VKRLLLLLLFLSTPVFANHENIGIVAPQVPICATLETLASAYRAYQQRDIARRDAIMDLHCSKAPKIENDGYRIVEILEQSANYSKVKFLYVDVPFKGNIVWVWNQNLKMIHELKWNDV